MDSVNLGQNLSSHKSPTGNSRQKNGQPERLRPNPRDTSWSMENSINEDFPGHS